MTNQGLRVGIDLWMVYHFDGALYRFDPFSPPDCLNPPLYADLSRPRVMQLEPEGLGVLMLPKVSDDDSKINGTI